MRCARLTAVAALLGLLGGSCGSEGWAAESERDNVTASAMVVSDYLMRGITQTWGRPALQGSLDLSLPNGLAAGAMASDVSEQMFPGGHLELDLYGSYGGSLAADWTWRAGVCGYLYPGANLDKSNPAKPGRSFNTADLNLALGWRQWMLGYARFVSDYYGADVEQGYAGDTRGSSYLELNADLVTAPGWMLMLHAGHTRVTNVLAMPMPGGARDPSYSDASATLMWQFTSVWSASLGLSHASNHGFYGQMASLTDPGDVKDVGGTRGVFIIQATL